MKHQQRIRPVLGLLAAGILALQPLCSAAQGTPVAGPWRYRASIYAYLPTVDATSSTPTDGGGPPINFDGGKILEDLQGFFMGSFEAHNGRWGVFTDFLYLHSGKDRQNSRDFSIGGVLDVSTSANLGWDLSGSIWSLAGVYRVLADRKTTVDLLAGVRMADIKQEFRWDISGSIGALAPGARSGRSERHETLWDGIIGVKGRYGFGQSGRWAVPFHFDIGTGESKLTWQAAGGLSYAFSWGEISGLWRYIAYEMKSGRPTQDLSFNGPMLGATFTF